MSAAAWLVAALLGMGCGEPSSEVDEVRAGGSRGSPQSGPDSSTGTSDAVLPGQGADPPKAVQVVGDSSVASRGVPPGASPKLSPLADTIAQRLVFFPVGERWFTASARAKRLLVDLGRIDIALGKDSARHAALREAAAAVSPVPKGARVQLRGPWGSDEATIAGFDAWNGRIVATLETAARVDSLARVTEPLVAAVQLLTTGAGADVRTAPAAAATDSSGRGAGARGEGESDSSGAGDAGPSCRVPPDPAFVARLAALARATEDSLRSAEDQPIYSRLRNALKARRSTATGCFGTARGVVIVTLYAGDYEWVRERVLLVGDSSTVRASVRDLRFRAHEALHALDADGDGVDDLAARAWTPRGGGTVILRLTSGKRFERLASGFAWER